MTKFRKIKKNVISGVLLSTLAVMVAEARPASSMIDGIVCPQGEQKFVLTLGIDDKVQNGPEAANPSTDVANQQSIVDYQTQHGHTALRQYDEQIRDKFFADSFVDIPRPVSKGFFIGGIKIGGSNDTLYLGKGDQVSNTNGSTIRHAYGVRLQDTNVKSEWTVTGSYRMLDLSQANLSSGAGTLLDYVNGTVTGSSARELDIIIQDDSPIDFATLVLCRTK